MKTVAIVGRPNVGKSTLFNRLIGERKAIVDDVSGVTRDRQYEEAVWNGQQFSVVDTGGYVDNSDDIFEKEIVKQVNIALEEADVIMFICDVATGITDLDEAFASLLRKTNKPILVVANKSDNSERMLEANEFYSLGFEEVFPVSSVGGYGTGDLLDRVVELLPKTETELASELPKIAIVGQPNAGKSSLLNSLIGEERTIVSDIAGTTRDSIHTHYNLFDKEFILIDTAGLKKKRKDKEELQFYSEIRAVKVVEDCDIIMLVIDAEVGVTAQDINIFSLAERKGKGIVVLMNKWDLVEKDTHTVKKWTEAIKKKIEPFTDVPILFISATEKQRIHKALELALEVFDRRAQKIPTSKLNDIMLEEILRNPPPNYRGLPVSIKFATQLPVVVPSFTFFANHPDEVKNPYKHFIENKMRKHFDFTGVPLRIFIRKK